MSIFIAELLVMTLKLVLKHEGKIEVGGGGGGGGGRDLFLFSSYRFCKWQIRSLTTQRE